MARKYDQPAPIMVPVASYNWLEMQIVLFPEHTRTWIQDSVGRWEDAARSDIR